MKVVRPRDIANLDEAARPLLFLAGSIDQGTAENWQERVAGELRDEPGTILNPRREEWDATLVQDVSNPEFAYQVDWELDNLARADVVLFHFSPGGPAPITLMELGTFAHRPTTLVVSCPPGYWRRGNVQVFCRRLGVPVHDSLDEALATLRRTLGDLDQAALGG